MPENGTPDSATDHTRSLAALAEAFASTDVLERMAGTLAILLYQMECSADGTYDVLYDEYGTGRKLVAALGEDQGRLRQEYGAAVILRRGEERLARHGFRGERETLPNGVVRVRMVRSAR